MPSIGHNQSYEDQAAKNKEKKEQKGSDMRTKKVCLHSIFWDLSTLLMSVQKDKTNHFHGLDRFPH